MGMERPYPCCHANCSASLPFHLTGGAGGGIGGSVEADGPVFKSAFLVTLQPLLPAVPSSGMETGPLLSSAAPLAPQLGLSETLVWNLSLYQKKRKRKHDTHM